MEGTPFDFQTPTAIGAAAGFSHGFAVHFGDIRREPDREFILVAPKGPGATLRRLFLDGRGLPALAASEPAASRRAWRLALAYARAIEADRTLADAHFNASRILERIGRPGDALRHLAEYRRLSKGA